MTDVDPLTAYLAWFAANSTAETLPDPGDGGEPWTVVTVPLLDSSNDHLRVFIRREGGDWKIADDKATIRDLDRRSRVDFTPASKRWKRAAQVLRGCGLDAEKCLESQEITATATDELLPATMNMMFVAMMGVGSIGC